MTPLLDRSQILNLRYTAILYKFLKKLQPKKNQKVVSGSARAGIIRTGKEIEFGKVSETPRPFILPMSASHYRTFGFSTVANGYPSGYWPYCGGLYDCSRNGKKVLL